MKARTYPRMTNAGPWMIGRVAPVFLALLLLLSPSLALAEDEEVVWVNDRVFLSLYPEPDSNSQRVDLLESGDRLERLGATEGNFVEVETEGGVSGWVNGDFLVEAPPARLRIDAVELERDELAATLDAREGELESLRQALAETESERDELAEQIEQQGGETLAPLDTRINIPLPTHLADRTDRKVSAAPDASTPMQIANPGRAELAVLGMVILLSLILGW